MTKNNNESDWKQFRDLVPELRERYLKAKNKALIDALSEKDKTPTERFWDTFEMMREESKILKDCLDGHSRSSQSMYMITMCRYGMMTEVDLERFSDELKDRLREFL